jgi:hypothetical protein
MAEFTKVEQIKALLESPVYAYDLLKRYVKDPGYLDFRHYYTVSQGDILEYLKAHPGVADAYVQNHRASTPLHDTFGLDIEDDHYVVFAWDHGKRVSFEKYATPEEAVAAYLVGLYALMWKIE